MDQHKIKLVIDRLKNVSNCVRNQRSGADVHTVNNIRHTAELLIEQLETDPDCMSDELTEQILKNTESKLIEFFEKKYPKN